MNHTNILKWIFLHRWNLLLSLALIAATFKTSAADIIFSIIFLSASVDIFKRKRFFPFSLSSYLNVAILVWVTANALGALSSSTVTPDQLDDFFSLRWVFSVYACAYAGSKITISERFLKKLFLVFALLIGIALFTTERDGFRFQGFYGNANVFSMAIAIPWAFMLGLTRKYQKKSFEHLLLLASFCVVSIGIFLSYTRGVWIAAIICLFLVAIIRKNKHILYLISTIGFSLSVMYLYNVLHFQDRIKYSLDLTKGSSQSLRITAWKVATQVFIDHPWFGTGFYGSYRIFPEYYRKMGYSDQLILIHAHNQYLQTLSDSGIVGFAAFILFFILILRYFFREYQTLEISKQTVALGGFLSVSIFLLSSMTESPLMVREARSFLILIAATAYGYLRKEEVFRPISSGQ